MVQKASSRQTPLTFWTFTVNLDLEHSNPIFSHYTPAYDAVPSSKVWLQKDQQFGRYSRRNHILIMWTLTVTLTLKLANQSFCATLHLMMMMYRHTKSGYKRLSGSGDITQTQSGHTDRWTKGYSDSNIPPSPQLKEVTANRSHAHSHIHDCVQVQLCCVWLTWMLIFLATLWGTKSLSTVITRKRTEKEHFSHPSIQVIFSSISNTVRNLDAGIHQSTCN